MIIDFTLTPSANSQEIKSYSKETLVCEAQFSQSHNIYACAQPKWIFTNAGMAWIRYEEV